MNVLLLMLLSTKFMAKCDLVFVLTQENAYSWRSHFNGNTKNLDSSAK